MSEVESVKQPKSSKRGVQCKSDPKAAVKKECNFRHTCWNRNCKYSHPPAWNPCWYGDRCDTFSCQAVHPPKRIQRCEKGFSCLESECHLLHPPDRPSLCSQPNDCLDYFCGLLHNVGRQLTCKSGVSCASIDCNLLHPQERKVFCAFGTKCLNSNCQSLHPAGRPRACKYGAKCHNSQCKLAHPDTRKTPCAQGQACVNCECPHLHPPTRRCRRRDACDNFNCPFLHAVERNGRVCQGGKDCVDTACTLLHPGDGIPVRREGNKCSKDAFEELQPLGSRAEGISGCPQSGVNKAKSDGRGLRSLEQRRQMRARQNLPILAYQTEFCDRLLAEKVLVVTAETGSGKTTQLPQYCADHPSLRGGLVVCTQPRALATISIAARVADEYDGGPVGKSVGYRVGGGKQVRGSSIMLVTDAALVRMAQGDRNLTGISVLMVDEAHERSLNTDIVLGIAKMVLRERPRDFYVIVASATIDPKPFLNFFFDDSVVCRRELSVAGRTFPVSVEERFNEDDDHSSRLDALVPTVLETLEAIPSGHCLAFLPGSNEVDTAVKRFRDVASPNIVALPLYGSLAPEDQQKVMTFDDQGGSLRMVVFCTNVAETSLTVPNVRIVVDTGLAKAARFDARRRMTVLEQVSISRSSANQRMGRAGRTAPGHCVRLFSLDDPEMLDSIQPEILRSSLDLVVLQLTQLGIDPLTFPFMDSPDPELVRMSLSLLTEFGCINEKDGGLTVRGRLFNDLPFDPRMSNFVLTAHEGYGFGIEATEVASILTAPGSIFFMGGAGNEVRELARLRVGEAAAKDESDLIFMRNVYLGWQEAGLLLQCTACCTSKKEPKQNGCRSCRAAHASRNGLNNKVLETVLTTARQVSRTLRSMPAGPRCERTLVESLGRSLVASFREQICEVLMPADPSAGCFLLDSEDKGVFAGTSFVMQTRHGQSAQRHVIVMSITRTPSGLLVVDQVHPLLLEWMPSDLRAIVTESSLDICLCYEHANVNPRFRNRLAEALRQDNTSSGRFVFVRHTVSESNTLRVFSPRTLRDELQRTCVALVDQLLKAELDRQFRWSDDLDAVFTAGLKVLSVDVASNKELIRFELPSGVDSKSLATWICNQTDLRREEIRYCKYFKEQGGSEPYGMASFSSAEATAKALELGRRAQLKEWGCVVQMRTAMTKEMLCSAINSSVISSKPAAIEVVQQPTFSIQGKNLPPNIDEAALRSFLGRGCQPGKVILHLKTQVGAATATLIFFSKADRDEGLRILEPLTQQFFEIFVPPTMRKKTVWPTLEGSNRITSLYSLSFQTVAAAEQFVEWMASSQSLVQASEVACHADVTVQLPDLFDLIKISQRITDKFGVKITRSAPKHSFGDERKRVEENQQCRFRITGSLPQRCRAAALAMSQATLPLRIVANSRRQRVFFWELRESGKLGNWAVEESLHVEFLSNDRDGLSSGFLLYGPPESQGAIMEKIATYSDGFQNNYTVILLESAARFRKGSVTYTNLVRQQATAAVIGGGGWVRYDAMLGGVEIYVKPTDEMAKLLENAEAAVLTVARNMGAKAISTDITACTLCHETWQASPLSICGHFFCQQCLDDEVVRVAQAGNLPARCTTCQTLISVRDLSSTLRNRDEATSFLRCAAVSFVRNSPTHSFGVCPTEGCNTLMRKDRGYSRCTGKCCNEVCMLCGLIGISDSWSSLHRGKSCGQFQKEKIAKERHSQVSRCLQESEFLQSIIQRAQKFVDDHFDANMDSPKTLQCNYCLAAGCPAVQSFCNALRARGGSNYRKLINSAIIGWHGAPSEEAIRSICYEGFDPKRRNVQFYGPGEYFGIKPSISSVFARDTQRLIVVMLLDLPETTKHNDFCYVVNNPLDKSMAFCLPVLVATYTYSLPPLQLDLHSPVIPLPFEFSKSSGQTNNVEDDTRFREQQRLRLYTESDSTAPTFAKTASSGPSRPAQSSWDWFAGVIST